MPNQLRFSLCFHFICFHCQKIIFETFGLSTSAGRKLNASIKIPCASVKVVEIKNLIKHHATASNSKISIPLSFGVFVWSPPNTTKYSLSGSAARISSWVCRLAVQTVRHPAAGRRPGRPARTVSDLSPAPSPRSSSWCPQPVCQVELLKVKMHSEWHFGVNLTSSTCACVCWSRFCAAICWGVRGPPTIPSAPGSPAAPGASPSGADLVEFEKGKKKQIEEKNVKGKKGN